MFFSLIESTLQMQQECCCLLLLGGQDGEELACPPGVKMKISTFG